MAKYKEYDYSQGKFIPLQFDKQILPGSLEHTLNFLFDNEIDIVDILTKIHLYANGLRKCNEKNWSRINQKLGGL